MLIVAGVVAAGYVVTTAVLVIRYRRWLTRQEEIDRRLLEAGSREERFVVLWESEEAVRVPPFWNR